MKNKDEIKCQECGGQEFITIPNRYDVYVVIDAKLELIDSLQAEGEVYRELYCRDCSEKLSINLREIQ